MAKILLIETSTEVCSAAISVDGIVVAFAEEPECKSHASLLTLQIEECTKRSGIPLAQLDAVALSRGPGSYTALRVGASVAKGICYALDKPLIAVDTLRALANAEYGIQHQNGEILQSAFFAPMLDARRKEVWLAVFDADMQQIAAAQPLILENNLFKNFIFDTLQIPESIKIVLSGSGMEKLRSGGFLENLVFGALKNCSASYLAPIAERSFKSNDFQDVAYFEPFYMKPPNITSPNKPAF